MRIKILGNGGAINNGLPYNSFIIDDRLLVETPPDIMLSLHREGVPAESVESVYLSHLHGDHTFGFAFLALRRFYEFRITGAVNPLTVYIPHDGREYLRTLIGLALSENHLCVQWVMENFRFITLSASGEFEALDYQFRLYRMEHSLETYGFTAHRDNRAIFAYTADTLWCSSVEEILGIGAGAVLLDMNGEPDDPVPVHMSEKEIIEKGIPLLKHGTTLYGTHLKNSKTSDDERIKYPQPGNIIVIE